MGNDIAIPNVRRALHFRIEDYEGTSFQSLSPKNQDVLVMKKRMTELGFEPADIWKDTNWFQVDGEDETTEFYDKVSKELHEMVMKTKGAA